MTQAKYQQAKQPRYQAPSFLRVSHCEWDVLVQSTEMIRVDVEQLNKLINVDNAAIIANKIAINTHLTIHVIIKQETKMAF
jgi:hypothetical protein